MTIDTCLPVKPQPRSVNCDPAATGIGDAVNSAGVDVEPPPAGFDDVRAPSTGLASEGLVTVPSVSRATSDASAM
jgi:hypothetical protein